MKTEPAGCQINEVARPVENAETLLSVRNLKTYFYLEEGVARAVDGVSFELRKGDTLGIVGESGCGKTVTALSIMRLVPSPPGRIVSGEVLFENKDLLKLSEAEMRRIRGNRISMIFQEPMTSLNPVFRIGTQIAEVIELHQHVTKKEAWARAVDMLHRVGIPSPETRAKEYPHQLSGGMRQRVMIAMALSCNPDLMIADEPTTALDVTIQAQILGLMNRLKEEMGMSIILITHDLGVIAEMAHHVAVMYAGVIVEKADIKELFANPLHPYTTGLMGSIPKLEQFKKEYGGRKERLKTISGMVPSLLKLPKGCRFSDRCTEAFELCHEREPQLIEVKKGHSVRCWKHEEY